MDRGEVGSNKKHTTKYQWQKAQQEAELAALNDEKVHAESIIQEAETAVETRDKALEEMKPLQEYLDAFKEAISGNLPLSPAKQRKSFQLTAASGTAHTRIGKAQRVCLFHQRIRAR